MSLDRYRQCLAVMNLPENERTWFPKWMGSYAARKSVSSATGSEGPIAVSEELVIEF
ncbi:hypothetical protein Q31b_50040 [Novipirellula aureliae]|uniref:Uncharacterized protein n=1 Tax=Novipirellula aureliae TaxID=2527966 RepID=A0A5C6DJF0_9BACT|nr:hypothetical protein [Novipirellula aureliae]TWU36722.1 hypothetical protein Q31b_50040 [Novipirellula aureliae]